MINKIKEAFINMINKLPRRRKKLRPRLEIPEEELRDIKRLAKESLISEAVRLGYGKREDFIIRPLYIDENAYVVGTNISVTDVMHSKTQ